MTLEREILLKWMSNLQYSSIMNIIINTNCVKSIKDIEEFLSEIRKTKWKVTHSKKESVYQTYFINQPYNSTLK